MINSIYQQSLQKTDQFDGKMYRNGKGTVLEFYSVSEFYNVSTFFPFKKDAVVQKLDFHQ